MECLKEYVFSKETFLAVDTHTMGEPTRIIVEGFPEIEGETMMDKKNYVARYYDHLRTALLLEPRGHRDMVGALLTKPVHKEADLGVIFMDSGGYLNMCGHGSIGTATFALETGMVKCTEPYTDIILDAPAGMIYTRVKVENGKAVEVSMQNVPAFLYRDHIPVNIDGYGEITLDIAFGGSFFALVNAQTLGLELERSQLPQIRELAMKILSRLNQDLMVEHPNLDIRTVDLVEFYTRSDRPGVDMKNVVIFGNAQTDRSPCGTGTSAKLAALYAKGELKQGQEFTYESITGTLFRGRVIGETKVGAYNAIIPEITGKAYITGINRVMMNEHDPLNYGFILE